VENTSIPKKGGYRYDPRMDQTPFELTAPEMVTPRLIALREALGLKKGEFADMIGIDRSSYTKIEKAQKPLLPPAAFKIWQLFGVDMNYVYLGRIDSLPPNLSSAIISNLDGQNA
jgi:DNA-binding XRE family transcriptional regulator